MEPAIVLGDARWFCFIQRRKRLNLKCTTLKQLAVPELCASPQRALIGSASGTLEEDDKTYVVMLKVQYLSPKYRKVEV